MRKIYARGMEPARKCHDCGKKTHDYRCKKCWAKLRERLGLPQKFWGENVNVDCRLDDDWVY